MQTTQLVAGNTLARIWTLLQITMAPMDLTSCNASFGMVPVLGGAAVLQIASTDGSPKIAIPYPTTGNVVMNVPAAATASFPPGLYICALTMTFSDGSVQTYDVENIQVVAAL